MAEDEKTQERSMRDILNVVFKYKWMIISVFVLVAVIAFLIALSKPDMYISNAKIMVSAGQAGPLEMVTGMSGPSEINSELELLRSRGLAEAIVDKIGPDKVLYTPEDDKSPAVVLANMIEKIGIKKGPEQSVDPIKMREKAIEQLTDTLSLNAVPRSTIIDISYQARTPEVAQEILQNTVETYMDKHIEIHTAAISLGFLSDETERIKAELTEGEEELRRFQDSVDIVSLPEQITFLLERIEGLQTAIEGTEADIYASQAAIEAMRPNIDLRDLLQQEEIRLESLQARLEILNEQIKKPNKDLADLRANERKYIFLQRRVETLDENYRRYLASLEQARIARTLESQEISNVSVMQKPTFIIEPISEGRKKILALGLFLGIIGGIGLAFILEYLNHKVRSVEDVEKRLALHNIAAIPPVNTRQIFRIVSNEGKREQKEYLLPPKVMSKNVTVWLYIDQQVRECFENIKNQVFLSMKTIKKSSAKAPYVLAVTSCHRGEGVSTVATGLAYTIALYEGENVLLVDSNRHHPDVDNVAGVNRPAGLYEMTVKPQGPGNSTERTTGFFSDRNMDDYLSQIKGSDKIDKLLPSIEKLNYKIIVLDLPSINEGVASVKTASAADGMILVIESEKVRREVVSHAKAKLEQSGANIFGVVLNKRRYYIPQWMYRRF
ncbi:MAG: hypothetical protein JXQ30_07760 [Spirochaetes bacterium]|nr:hypothetical protein [Spirochaetota bacterium]